MKINIDDQYFIEMTDLQERVIKHFIFDEDFQDDMIRRVEEAITGKYLNCFRRLKEEWDPKLEESGISMIPTNKDEYAKLVFSQPNYKSRSQRDSKA
jgi:hypothetical protein